MKRLGIRHQILLITLVPVFVVDSILTYNHVRDSIAQQQVMLQNEARIIARQIAAAIELNRMSSAEGRLQQLLSQAVDADDIVHASIYDSRGERLAEASASRYNSAESADYRYFRQPLRLPNANSSDALGTEADQSRTPASLNLYISHSPLRQKTMQILLESGLFFILALIVAVLLTILISRRITQPVFRLIEHLRYVETGQLGKTIEHTEANEIGALQTGFNRMSHALLANRRHLNHRIQQATQQLNESILDLETRNRELGLARDLAQAANRSKSEFLANMSHEIRTPINGIKGFIGLLGRSSLNPSQQRYVDIILKSSNDLGRIIDEILDFSKMESGKLHIVDEVFDLYEVIEQTRDLLFFNVLDKDIDLNLIIFSDTPRWVIGDKLRLKQILLNLIGNAIKFTEKGRVVVQVSPQDLDDNRAEVVISVADSGIGISAKDQETLFQAFGQVESSNTRRFTGTGLGLVISKSLARLMGGDISMESVAGEGSRFSVTLPFRLDIRHLPEIEVNAVRTLIFAADQSNLMEIRTLFDRAGAMTEAELIDSSRGVEPILQTLQRTLACVDLLVFDLRRFEIDLRVLLGQIEARAVRIIVMHYDPGYELPINSERVEFASIISTSARIRQLLRPETVPAEQPQRIAESTGLDSKRVLLVDDNQVNLQLASELIRLWGHEVSEAGNAEAAFEIYRRERFDLIILDIQMPDIDGVSLLQMMRELRPEDDTPVVALTANVLNHEAERLLDLGFDYFLGKPVDEARFRALLDGQHPRASELDAHSAAGDRIDATRSLDFERSLQLAAGNESLLRQILEILRRDIPQQRQHLQDAFSCFDLDRLGALAHKLHGVTCYASLPRLRRIVIAFEQKLATATPQSLQSSVTELDVELTTVEQEVGRYLRELQSA